MDMDDLYDLLDYCEDGEIFIIHRGPGNHVEDDCWCYPMELPANFVFEAEPPVLKEVLDQFFRIH